MEKLLKNNSRRDGCCDTVGMGAVTEWDGKAFKKQLQTGWVL